MAATALLEDLAAHRRKVRGVLIRMVRDESVADDLVQEAFLRAIRAADGHRREASATTWLTAIALNLARDHLGAVRRETPCASVEQADSIAACGEPETEMLRAELSGCILGHVARLPVRQREAVLLHHFGGFSHREVASSLGVSEGNARLILHRGLATLRGSLEHECRLDFDDPIPCERKDADRVASHSTSRNPRARRGAP